MFGAIRGWPLEHLGLWGYNPLYTYGIARVPRFLFTIWMIWLILRWSNYDISPTTSSRKDKPKSFVKRHTPPETNSF
jgi:hypothetical protein